MQEQEYDIVEQDDPKPRPSLKGKPRPTLEKKKGQVGGEFGIGSITGSEIPTIQLEKSELGIPSTSNKEFAKNNLDPSVIYDETILANSVNTGSPILGEIQIKDQDIPVANKQLYRKDLQDRIANKKLLDEDVSILSIVTGKPKDAIVAYISGRDGKGLMLEFDNAKAKKSNEFTSLIEKNNSELGLNDTFESVFATPETTKNYLDKIQQAYDNKTERDFNSLNTRTIDGKTITYDEESERYIDKRLPAGRRYYDAIKNKNDAAVAQFKNLVGEDIFRKIADEPDKTYDQKVKQAGDILYDTELKKIEKAKGKRSSISAISDYFPLLKLSGIFRDEKSEEQNLNAINSVVETRLNRAIKEQIIYDQAALANLAQDVSEKTANGTVTEQDITNYKEAAEQLRNKIDEKQKEYKTPQQLQKKYPVLLKQSVINDINEFNAIQSGNVKGYEDGGYEGINLAEHLKAQGYDMNDQVVKDAIVDAVKGVGIKDYSFFGEPIKAIKEVFTSSAKSLGDITGLRDDVTVLSEKTAEELFPTQVGNKDEYQLTESAKIGQNIGNTTGQVLGQGLMQFGTAGIGRLAGLSKVASANAGFWSSGALTSYDNAYKDSMDFVDSDAGRTAYAGLIALANAASEKIFPEAKLFNIPGVKSAFSELATKMSTNELTDKLATQLLTKAKNAFIDYGEKYVKNVGKETLEETATSLFESGTRFIFGDPNIDYDKAIELAKNTAIQTAIGTSVIGGFGAHKDVQLEKNVSPKSIIYNAAVYHDEAMDALNIGFKTGQYDQQELNQKISLLNTAQVGLGELKKAEDVIGRELSRPQKELFVANTTAQRLLTKQKDGVEDAAVLHRIDEKLKNLNAQQAQLLDNKVQIDEVGNVIVPEKEKITTEEIKQTEIIEETDKKGVPVGEDVPPPNKESIAEPSIPVDEGVVDKEASTVLSRGDVEVSDREMYDAVGKDATDYVKKSESQLGYGVIDRNRVIETAKRIAKTDGKSKVDVAAVAEAVQYETGYENKFDDLRKAGQKETIKRMIDVGVGLPKDIIDKFKEQNYTINKEKGDYGTESYDLKSDYGRVSGHIGDAYDWKNNKKVDGKEISVARIDAKEIGKGQGEELLKSVIDYANKNDIKYVGSTSLNETSRRTFEKLEKKGLIKPALEGVNNKTITWEIVKDQSLSSNTPSKEQATKPEINNEPKSESQADKIPDTKTGDSTPKPETGKAAPATETGDEGGKEPPPEISYESEKEEPKKVRSVYKNVIERSKLTKEQKELLKADPSALYTALPNETAKQIALDIIKEMGVEAAVAEASRKNSALEPVEKVMVLGAAMDYYAGLAKDAAKAKNENAVQENSELEIDANEKMLEVARTLAGYGTDFGRAINIFNEIYKLSNLALERKLKNTVAKINAIRNSQAEKDAKVVEAIVKDETKVVSGIGNEMTESDISKESDINKKVSELENEVKDLREQIKNLQNAKTGSKNNPLKIKRTTDATEYDKRIKEFKSRQRTGISKDDLNDLTYFGLYHLENGATKFAEWVKIMAQKFNGFREYLEGIYHNIKQDAIDKGADKDLFDSETETQKHLQDLQKNSDARKIANATKRLATANLRKAQENNPDNARIKAPVIAAERIRKDAEKNLDLPTTKNEQTYLKKLVQVVQNKAKEYYKESKENTKNVNDWLAFAIANGKADYAIWERTQEAVESQIDADKNLSDEQKEEVKDFLSDYQDSVFDTLLTTNQKEEIIRQKLIEAGFGAERTVNGKIIKAVDWNKVIGNAKNIKDAKAAIVKSITDLGYTLEEASNEINSILTDFDNKVADKKTKAINSFLNKGVINKAKNALGLNRKSKVQKLIDMNNKGILDDVRVKDVLAKDLGIISLTENDLAKVRELSDKIDNATVPFIKKKYEEQLQYLFDSKSGNIVYLENREFVMNNRLTSLWNQIQNLTGYFRVLSTYIATSIKTGNPVGMAKVFRKQWKDGVSDALTVLMGGHVSRGTAFSDLTRSTEGEARVRYLEQGKGKLLGLPDLYLRVGGKTFQINPFNALYRKIKYVGRLMESADTIPSNIISGLTQYWQIQKQVKLLNPELNSKQVESKAYDIMYSIDTETAKTQAVKDLKESGINSPTKYEINRASHEIVERKRNELISKEFYDRVEELKPTAKEKLEQQGNDNPSEEDVINEVYNILGIDEPLDIVARGERQALRETGKKTTAGITAILLFPIDGAQQRLKKEMLNRHGVLGKTTANVADAAFNQLLPFANSIGRWIEMGLELTPYGVIKGAGYKGYAEVTKITGNQKLNPVELHELGDDYIIRGLQGTAVTLTAMWLMGMLKGGDDEEEDDKITGSYQGKDFKKERIKQIGNPQRSLDIGGRKFPLDLLGAAAYPLMMYSDFLDRRTDENERHGVLYTTAAMYLNTAGQSAYGRIDQYGGILTDIFNAKDDKYLPKLGKISGSYLGAQFIPFNRFQQEIGELWNPKSTTSITFGENLLQQFSMVGGLMKDHPAFDYRGREYDKGDIWVGSPDGIVKMFTKSKTADEIDSELARIDFAASDAYRESRDEENYKYTIENEDGTNRFMTPQEYYEFKKETGVQFDEKLLLNFETIKNITINNTEGNYDENETLKVQREAYSALLTKSKENALSLIQSQTGHIPDAELNKKEKEEKSKNTSTQKKEQVVLINN